MVVFENHYFIFECKNEVSDNREEINKHEAGQMNSHCAWFKSEYGDNVSVSRFTLHSDKELSCQADFEHDVKIIRKRKAERFKTEYREQFY